MRKLYIDFECFFDTQYSLKKMSTSLYIFDKRFKIHGFSLKWEDREARFYSMTNSQEDWIASLAIDTIDWPNTHLIGHHLQFDALILTHYFGVKDIGRYSCTLSMARPLMTGVVKSMGLDSLANYFLIGGKLEGLEDTKGKRNLSNSEMQQLGLYCNEDVRLCEEVFNKLAPNVSAFEQDVIDWHIRAYAEPEFHVDKQRAQLEVDKIMKEKEQMFASIETYLPPELEDKSVEQVLRSGPMFAQTLEYNDIPVPMKKSLTTGKMTHAFAKTDKAFVDLEHHSTASKILMEARLKSKSDTALNKARLLLEFAKHEPMPIYMNYARAVTLRSSGGDKIQAQNFPRGGEARKCLIAPPGHKVVSIDSSGIELRMALWFSQQDDLLDLVRNGEDLYCSMASDIYDRTITKNDKHERMVGKVLILAAQYGAGAPTVHKIMSQGLMGPPIDISLHETEVLVHKFRAKFNMVADMWGICTQFLGVMCTNPMYDPVTYKGISFDIERAHTHNGMHLYLPDLHVTNDGSYQYSGANCVPTYVYGSKFYNYLVQHQARDCIEMNTLVLTNNGWKPMYSVLPTDLVHDGIDFVPHAGVLCKGVKQCINLNGVYMTPDHEVLNEKQEWRKAEEVSKPYRPKIRYANCSSKRKEDKILTMVGLRMRLWRDQSIQKTRSNDGSQKALWLLKRANRKRRPSKARTERSSVIRGMEWNERTLLQTISHKLQKLWRSWNNNMQSMARRSQFYFGQRECLSEGFNYQSYRQQQRVQSRQLRMDTDEQTVQKLDSSKRNTNTKRSNEFIRSVTNFRDTLNYFTQQTKEKRTIRPTISKTVGDIVNCGPRNRFVVMSSNGPIVVHNCVYEQINQVAKRYKPLMAVHDETTIIVPDEEVEEAEKFLLEVFRTPPKWCPDLPLNAETDIGQYYSK